ncbi:hypothetical protein HY441_02500 [Candidatus Microgenomates bacterium]|nr:hypothetical protein [Candidatus Microgenomates bacterium]
MDQSFSDQPQVSGPPKSKSKAKKVLVTLLVMALVGGSAAGVWYWQQQKVDKANSQVAELSKKVSDLEKESKDLKAQLAASATTTDDTASWKTFKSTAGVFTVKYPASWLTKTCEGNEATLYLAPSEDTQAICATEKGSPISVSSAAGDQRFIGTTDIGSYGDNVKIEKVTVNGVAGQKVSYTHKGNEFVAAGTKQVTYEFLTGGRTYNATYSQAPGEQDYLSIFETLVTKTLQFAAS